MLSVDGMFVPIPCADQPKRFFAKCSHQLSKHATFELAEGQWGQPKLPNHNLDLENLPQKHMSSLIVRKGLVIKVRFSLVLSSKEGIFLSKMIQ